MQKPLKEERKEQLVKRIDTMNEFWCKAMRVPKRFNGKLVSNYNGNTDKVETAMKSLKENRSVYIHGNCGTGKTHLAVGLMMEYLRIGNIPLTETYGDFKILGAESWMQHAVKYLPYFLPSVELFYELKASFDRKDTSELEIIDKYSQCPLLVIDDVGAEKVSDWSRQIFYMLIDRRYRDMKQTIITTNKTPDEIATLIDDRITSRIFEMGEVIEIKGNDKRIS